ISVLAHPLHGRGSRNPRPLWKERHAADSGIQGLAFSISVTTTGGFAPSTACSGFRYFYGGKLLLATTKLQDPGTCRLCGSPRQYELQLMSSLSTFSMKLETTPQIMYPAAGLGWLSS
uniref:Uncharacterized protein n=1 Tax=Zea mays TaxID=4577 RepID=A0A804QWY5_MAIZE